MLPIDAERDTMDHVSQEYWHGQVRVNNLVHKCPLYYFALHLLCKHPSIISKLCSTPQHFLAYVETIFLYTHNCIAIKHTNNNQPWSWPYQVSYLHTQQLTTSVSLSLCTIYSRWICAIAAAKIYIVFANHKVIKYIILFTMLFKFRNQIQYYYIRLFDVKTYCFHTIELFQTLITLSLPKYKYNSYIMVLCIVGAYFFPVM